LKAEVAEAKFEEERLIQSIVRESAGLINTHRVEQSRSDILTEMIGIRDDQLASMSRKFNAGQVTLIELMNVQQDLSDARAASVDSDASSCGALLNLEQMTGRGLRAVR
jgi:outer membrane protein TolC